MAIWSSESASLAPTTYRPSVARGAAWTMGHSVHWVLRVGAAMCFIGHGAFGIITKEAWVPFFAVVGIPRDWAFSLMPVVGAVDIAVGVATLLAPRPVFLLYMAVWGLWTALLRPLAGDTVWETVERAGNYGVPFALLLLAGGREALRDWLGRVRPLPAPADLLRPVATALRWSTALLLLGHGALGALTGKALLAGHYAAVGLPPVALPVVGWFEIALAAAVLARPTVALLAFVAAWKIATEALFPIAGAPVWEFIERGGSYAAPIALALITARRSPAGDAGRAGIKNAGLMT